jgi:ferredoxin, 2Fe-2S
MPKVVFVETDGSEHEVDVAVGMTVMEAARNAAVPGVDADCGGACACATCHVHIDPAWSERAGLPGPLEEAMLDEAVGHDPYSRLSCQIQITPALDGLRCFLPVSQRK